MQGARRVKYITKTKDLFIKYYKSYNTNYKGFDYKNELPTFEFGINIVEYLVDESIKYVLNINIRISYKNILTYMNTISAI